MKRRDISLSMLGMAAGAAAVSRTASAATCSPPPCYPQTADEISASVSPVNTQYPPGYVDRYGTNTTPGSTPMATAFNNAVKVAKVGRCKVRWGATAPYLLEASINCTSARGILFEDESAKNASAGAPSLVIGHNGHGFDLAASTELVFNNVSLTSASGFVPLTAFFAARNPAGSGAGTHRFYNLRTPSACRFKNIYYGYGSEENNFINCFIYNSEANSTCFHHNVSNPLGYTSAFTSIATGNQSNVCHRHIGGDYFNQGGGGSESVFVLDGAPNFTFRDGAWDCPHGIAYLRVIGTQATSWLTLDSIRGEPDVARPTYGIQVTSTGTTGGNSHIYWTLNNVFADSTQELLYFGDAASIFNLSTTASASQSGKLVSVHTMSNSYLQSMTNLVTGRAGGNVSNNVFVGYRQNVTLFGSFSNNSYDDVLTGTRGGTGFRFPATSVPSADPKTLDDYAEGTFVPVITPGAGSVSHAAQTGSFTKIGRLVTVQIYVQVASAFGPGGILRIAGLPYVASAGIKGAASVYANSLGASVNGPVYGFVDPAGTTISLYKFGAGVLANLAGDIGAGTNFLITASYEV